MENARDFLGRGLAFPLRVDPATGRFVQSAEEENIRQSILLILGTRRGERAMLPEFGCDLYRYVFELPDDAYLTLACSDIVDALTRWEPRIVDVEVTPDVTDLAQGKLVFTIGYTVRATNNPNNLVYCPLGSRRHKLHIACFAASGKSSLIPLLLLSPKSL